MDSLTAWMKAQPSEKLIEVDSAFMMLAIYKIPSIRNCRYDGIEWHSGFFGLGGHSVTCEHAPFHQCIREKNGGRVRILPSALCSSFGRAQHVLLIRALLLFRRSLLRR